MKKSVLSLFLVIFCMVAFGQGNNGNNTEAPTTQATPQPKMHCQPQGHTFNASDHISLIIASPNNERFWLYVNNMIYTRHTTTTAKVDLNPNFIYSIKVVMDNRRRDIISEYICLGGNGNDIILTVEQAQSHGFGFSFGHENNRNYSLRWNGQEIQPGNGNYTYIWKYQNSPYSIRYTSGMDIYPISPVTTPQPVIQPVPQPCPLAEFLRIKNIVKAQTFDNERMNVAMTSIRGKMLTAVQIAELAELFSFDSSRLAFLKAAYSECYDPQNYYVVYKVLDFSSSKDELTRFLEGTY